MDVDVVADARVQRGDHERLALVGEAEVRDERLVEDRVDGVAVVGRLLVQAADAHALGRRGGAATGCVTGGLTVQQDAGRVVLRPGPLTRPPRRADDARGWRGDDTTARGDDRRRRCSWRWIRNDAEPLRRQLAGELREAIRAGRLRTGVRLPASRALAAQLGVSRGVVTDAYEQLGAEGWLAARRGAGTVWPPRPAIAAPPREPPRRAAVRVDFTPDDARRRAVPAPRLGARDRARCATAPDAALDYGDGRGAAALREALAALPRARPRRRPPTPGAIVVMRRLQPGRSCSLCARARAARRAPRRDRGPVALRPLGHRRATPASSRSPVPVDDGRAARRRARRDGRRRRRRHARATSSRPAP